MKKGTRQVLMCLAIFVENMNYCECIVLSAWLGAGKCTCRWLFTGCGCRRRRGLSIGAWGRCCCEPGQCGTTSARLGGTWGWPGPHLLRQPWHSHNTVGETVRVSTSWWCQILHFLLNHWLKNLLALTGNFLSLPVQLSIIRRKNRRY